MRVRLTYATDLKAVPEQVANLIEKSTDSLNELTKLLSSSNTILKGDDDSADYVVHLIDIIRSKLSTVDESLTDVHSLLQGYVSATNPQKPPAPAQPSASPEPPVPSTIPEAPEFFDDNPEWPDGEDVGC